MEHTEIVLIIIGTIVVLLLIYLFFSKRQGSVPAPEPAQRSIRSRKFPQEPQGPQGPQGTPALALFYADWCGHCQNLKPVWDKLAQEYDGYKGIKMIAVNGDQRPQLTQAHNVRGYPTIKYCPQGLETPVSVMYQGDRSPESIVEFLQRYA